MPDAKIAVHGELILEAFDRDGRCYARRVVDNLIVTGGLAWLSGAITGDVADPTVMKYIGIGTDNTAPVTTDTTLGAEVESRATGSQSRVTTALTNDTYQAVGTVSITDTRAIVEAGLFSASSSGTMGSRSVFSAINMVSGDSLQVTYKWVFSDAS